MDIKTTNRSPTVEPLSRSFDRVKVDWTSLLMTVATGFCVVLILAMLAVILAYIGWHGADAFSLRFISSGVGQDMFDAKQTGVLPMILGTCARVMLMTLFVMPMGVITAVYLTEYAPPGSRITRILRGAVNNLAGVPSIVFGLFGLGFFISFVGGGLDNLFNANATAPHFRSPALIWASLTLAIMTMPVVIVATEESLRSIPQGLRSASLALGATKLQTITRVVLPQALPGILTGGILAVSRAAGEVAPILFTGAAYYVSGYPDSLTSQFMDLGYHIYILSTQSPDVQRTEPILFATVMTLLVLTFSLNALAVLVRSLMRRRIRLAV